MEFVNSIIYKTAIDYAKENNHPKIVELLMKGVQQVTNVNDTPPINMAKTLISKQENKNIIPTRSQNKEEKIQEQEREIDQLKKKNQQQEREIDQLKEENQQQALEIEQQKKRNNKIKKEK